MALQQQVKELKTKYNWVERLEELGYDKDTIMNILINENKKQGNLINIVSLLELKENIKEI